MYAPEWLWPEEKVEKPVKRTQIEVLSWDYIPVGERVLTNEAWWDLVHNIDRSPESYLVEGDNVYTSSRLSTGKK